MENEVVLFNGVVYEKTGEEIKGALLVDQKKHATGGYQTVLVDGESAMVTQEAGEYDPDEEDDVTAEGHKYVVSLSICSSHSTFTDFLPGPQRSSLRAYL